MSAWTTAYEHVVTHLTDDEDLVDMVGGRIYQGTVPAGPVTYPLILIQPYGDATDVISTGPIRVATALEVSVRVIAADTSLVTLEGIAQAIDGCLNATGPVTNTRGHVAACVRVAETDMTELADGQTWRYLGSRYRLLLTQTS